MSFAGAVRIYLSARQAPPSRRGEPDALPPIGEGRSAAWAHRNPALARATIADIHSLTDARSRLPDGSIGRMAVVLNPGSSTVDCQVASLERVRAVMGAGPNRA